VNVRMMGQDYLTGILSRQEGGEDQQYDKSCDRIIGAE
jgi:hypothetical protein